METSLFALDPLELEAQADELEAEALRLRARAKRAQLHAPSPKATATTDLDERAAAAVVGTSLATFKRTRLEADYFVGMRPRWRDAESVRAKFAARGRVATTPVKSAPKERDVELGDLTRAGLRAIAGGAR